MASERGDATQPAGSKDQRSASSTPTSASDRRTNLRSGTSAAQEAITPVHNEAEPLDNGENSATHITETATADTSAVELKEDDDDDDDDEICAICHSGEFTDDNLIVFCEGKCHLGFHQRCYGIENIPPGDEPWLCDWCAVGNITTYSKNLYCCHYKVDKSARTLIINDGRSEPAFVHVHVQCAAWMPDVDTSHIPFTTSIHKPKAAKTKCYFCNSRSGFQVKCEHVDGDTPCGNGFHPMCAMRFQFLDPPTQYNTKFVHHVCPEHTPEKLEKNAKRRRASEGGTSIASKRVTRRQSALPFSSSRGTSRSLLDSHSPSPSTADDRQSQPRRRVVRLTESMDEDVSGSDTSPRRYGSSTPSSGGQEGSKRLVGRKKKRPRRGSSAPGRQDYYNKTIVKVHNELSRLRVEQASDDDDDNQDDSCRSIKFGSHASDQEDEVIDSGTVAGHNGHAPETDIRSRSRSRSVSNSAVAADKTSPTASNGNRNDKRRLTLRLGNIDAESNSGNSSDETIDDPIVSGSRGKNANRSKTNTESAPQNIQRSSPLPAQSPNLPAVPTDPASTSKSSQSSNLPAVAEDRASTSQNNQSLNLPAVSKDRASTSTGSQPLRKQRDTSGPQRINRSVVQVRPYELHPSTPPSGIGAGGYPYSAGHRANPPLSALEYSQRVAAASVKMPEEQVAMMKETHEMMKAQSDMLKSVHSMIKDLVNSPSRQAQQALSTIGNLSAAVSNGVNGDSATANGSGSGSVVNAGSSGANGALALPKPHSQSNINGSTASSVPRPYSGAAELHLPKSAAASPRLPASNWFAPIRPSFGPTASSGITHSPGRGPANVPGTPRPLSANPSLDGDELEEMKENMIYLIKAVNIPQVLSGMISTNGDHALSSSSSGSGPISPTSSTSDSKRLPPQLKTMLADLRRFGALSKDNVHEYLKVLVSSMKDVRSKHV